MLEIIFTLFPTIFFYPSQKEFRFFQLYSFCCLHMLSIWTSLKLFSVVKSKPFSSQSQVFPNKPCFYVSTVQVFRKHWGKEKLLIMSNFSFSNNVFYPLGELSAIFIKFEIVVCKLLQFGRG